MLKRKVTARQSAPSFLDHDSRYSGFRSRLASSRPTFSSSPRAESEVLDAIKEGMDAADKDVPFSLLYLYDDQAAFAARARVRHRKRSAGFAGGDPPGRPVARYPGPGKPEKSYAGSDIRFKLVSRT